MYPCLYVQICEQTARRSGQNERPFVNSVILVEVSISAGHVQILKQCRRWKQCQKKCQKCQNRVEQIKAIQEDDLTPLGGLLVGDLERSLVAFRTALIALALLHVRDRYHQFSDRDQMAFFLVFNLYWRSPESSNLWYKSWQLMKTI